MPSELCSEYQKAVQYFEYPTGTSNTQCYSVIFQMFTGRLEWKWFSYTVNWLNDQITLKPLGVLMSVMWYICST